MRQKTLSERKTRLPCGYQQWPKIWMSNLGWLTRWLNSWTVQTEKFVRWIRCGTLWTNKRVPQLRSAYLQEKKRKRNLNLSSRDLRTWWTIKLTRCNEVSIWWNYFYLEHLFLSWKRPASVYCGSCCSRSLSRRFGSWKAKKFSLPSYKKWDFIDSLDHNKTLRKKPQTAVEMQAATTIKKLIKQTYFLH